jgi:glutathione S-transferase
MLALYHNAFSTCSQKVRLVLAEKGLSFESREVDLIGGAQHDPDYVKLNP